jgi:hypothetical protein
VFIVPVTADPDSRRQIRLGTNTLTLRTYYVPAAAMWFLDIANSDGVTLAAGLALVPNINVLEWSPELTRTLGQFRVFPLDSDDENTAQDAIAPLWWFAPGEWEALAGNEVVDASLPFDVMAMYSLLPGVPPFLVPLVVAQLEAVTIRLYKIVNVDFYPRLT